MKESSFFSDVFKVVRQIPRGRVTTYGAIAKYLGLGAARMVGWALNHSLSNDLPVPAHRVVNRKGVLSGKHHFGGEFVMEQMLEAEGVHVDDDQVMDFNELLWLPIDHLPPIVE